MKYNSISEIPTYEEDLTGADVYSLNGVELRFFYNLECEDTICIDGEYLHEEDGDIVAPCTKEDYALALSLINEREAAQEEKTGKAFIGWANYKTPVYACAETYAHMKAHPDVSFSDVQEALDKIHVYGRTFFMGSINMGRIVGKDHCIQVTDEQRPLVTMEQRPNRDGLTPMIEAEPEDTSLLTVGLCLDDGLWTLFTAFYGALAPKEPWDPRLKDEEREESERFWATHALCK